MKRNPTLAILVLASLLLISCSISFNLFDPPAPTSTPVQPTLAQVEKVEITVYFTDENMFLTGTEPYEKAVKRMVLPPPADWPADILNEYYPIQVLQTFFTGPTADEYAQGLRLVSSGFTTERNVYISDNGVVHVYLGGTCANNGAAYSVANLIYKNLSQFPEVKTIKIYDENDSTLSPEGTESSLPYCLEP